MDDFKQKILALLQQDATLSTSEIAEQIGLSQAPCWRRIDRLKKDGIIKAQVALVDRRKIGLNAVRDFPEVLECFVLMGQVDFLLRIVAADIDAHRRFFCFFFFFFEKLSRVPGIQEVNSIVALSQIKGTTALPI